MGAILAVTEIQPLPPFTRKAKKVASSPDNCMNLSPHKLDTSNGVVRSAVASFTPTIFLILESFLIKFEIILILKKLFYLDLKQHH